MAHSNAVQLAEHVGAALTADGATGIVTAYKFVGDGSSLTGIDATSIKDSGGTVRAQAYTAGVTVTGVLTATSLEGDGSALSNLPAGLGTAISGSGDGSLFYYTDSVLTVGSNLTLDSPTSAPVIYTQYPEVAVSSGVDLTIADGDELVTDALGISTAGVPALSGSGGRIRADNYTSYDATDAPNFPQGANITGVSTFNGDVTFKGDAYDVLWDKSTDDLKFPDNASVKFGTGNDLEIYHDSNHSYIQDTGTGELRLRTNTGLIRMTKDDTETLAAFNVDGAVELYHDNAKKIETASGGISLTGGAACNINALTDGASIAIDMAAGLHHSVTLGGNRAFAAPTNQAIGQSGSIFITQDGTGSRTASWNAAFKWAGGTAPTLTTTASAVDRIDYLIKASNVIHAVATLDVK